MNSSTVVSAELPRPRAHSVSSVRLAFALRAVPALTFAAGLLAPIAWVALNGWTLTGQYEESIGYRYFYSLRLVYEPGQYVFLPQGHFQDLIYKLLQSALTLLGHPPDSLFPRIDYFSYAAVAAGHLAAVAAFCWAVAPLRTTAARLCGALFWLLPYYFYPGIYGHGAILQPDYHIWVLPMGIIAAGFFTRWPGSAAPWSLRDTLLLGAFIGLALATKTTLLIFPLTVGLGWLLARSGWPRSGIGAAAGVTIGVGLWALVLLAHYNGFFWNAVRLVQDLRQFGESARADLSYQEWLGVAFSEPSWIVTVAVALPLALLPLTLVATLVRSRRWASVLLSLLVGAVAYHWVLYSRYVPVSWFEAIVFVQLTLWAMLVTVFPGLLLPGPAQWLASGLLAYALATSLQTIGGYFPYLQFNHAANQQLAQVLRERSGPVAFLIPSNFFRPVSVDSAIYKGGSDIFDGRFGTSPLVREMFPDREYFTNSEAFYQSNPLDLGDFSMVIFTYPRSPGFSTASHMKLIEDHYQTSLGSFACDQEIDYQTQWLIVCRRPHGGWVHQLLAVVQ